MLNVTKFESSIILLGKIWIIQDLDRGRFGLSKTWTLQELDHARIGSCKIWNVQKNSEKFGLDLVKFESFEIWILQNLDT